MVGIIYTLERFIMVFIKQIKGTLIIVSILLSSCTESPGYGISLDFDSQKCDSMRISDIKGFSSIQFRIDIFGESALRDAVMEAEIEAYYNRIGVVVVKGGSVCERVSYRIDKCKKISIVANRPFLDRLPGSELSDFFTVNSRDFLFAGSKKLIGRFHSSIPISEYLSYYPMALPSMTIKLGVPQKDLNIVGDIDITICVTLESGVELKDTFTMVF